MEVEFVDPDGRYEVVKLPKNKSVNWLVRKGTKELSESTGYPRLYFILLPLQTHNYHSHWNIVEKDEYIEKGESIYFGTVDDRPEDVKFWVDRLLSDFLNQDCIIYKQLKMFLKIFDIVIEDKTYKKDSLHRIIYNIAVLLS